MLDADQLRYVDAPRNINGELGLVILGCMCQSTPPPLLPACEDEPFSALKDSLVGGR